MSGTGFDSYAESYDEALHQAIGVSGESREYFARGRTVWLSRRLARLGVRPASVLDFGCGTGTGAPFLIDILGATRVVGIDVSVPTLEKARRTYGSERVSFASKDDYRPRGEIDLAFTNGVFHHIPPRERADAVSYVRDALRPGGLFALWENNAWNPATRLVMSRCPFDRDAITLTPPEARRLLRDGGFDLLGTDFLFIFPRIMRWLRFLEPPLCRLPLGTQYLVLGRIRP